MNQGNEIVEEFWITLRNVCTGTMVLRGKRGPANTVITPETRPVAEHYRPDIYR